jgi:sarcosine oxidase subunit beta
MSGWRTYDVGVVGGGVIGAAIVHALSAQGIRSLLIEARHVGAGATGSSSAVVRVHYTNPHEARLALYSTRVFQEWADRIGGECGYRRTGLLRIVAPDDADRMRRNVDLLQRLGANVELLSAHHVAALDPLLTSEGIGAAAFEPDGGYADASRTADEFVRAAQRNGATVVSRTPVRRILADEKGVTELETDAGRIPVGAVVVACGAWSAPLLAPLGIHLNLRSKLIRSGFIQPSESPKLTVMDDSVGTYFKPEGKGIEFGLHYTWDVEPVEHPMNVPTDEVADGVRHIARRAPAFADAGIVRGWGAVDAFTPDGAALIGPVLSIPGLYVATGFSGTGFKIAPAVGVGVSDLITGATTELTEVDAFRPERFTEGALLTTDSDYRRAPWRHQPPGS